MEITMWALGFLCLDEAPSCVKFTPVVLQAIPGSSPSKLGFFSLWEEQDGGILANSVASKVLTIENWSMSKESLSGMNLRSLDAKLDLCKGLELHPAHDRSNQELLGGLDLQSFDVKTAPEAAGFRLNERVTNITRPNRRLCLLGIDDNTTGSSLDSSLSFDLRTTTTLVEILGSFMSQVKNSYIQAQSSALDLEHPGTDFWVAAVALPGAFIAVVAAAQPFINFQLTFFRNLVRSQGWKTALLCVSNSVLALGSYSAIITVTPAEIQRQEKLRTWGLLADQVPITNRGLQVLVVVKGESSYRSDSLLLVWCSTAVLVPVIAWMTFYRCKQVFYVRRMLKLLAELEPERHDADESNDERLDDLRAIEMGSVEQRQLEKRLAKMNAMPGTSMGNVIVMPFLLPPRRMHIHQADARAFATWLQENLPLVHAILTFYGWMEIVGLQGCNDPLPREFTIHLREARPVEVPQVPQEGLPNLVPFSDVVCNFTLPFRGRDGLVQKLAETIDDLHNFRI
ncbi:hypothetical protein SELMODRAFT_420857 [Selaginella moellendorffii]|uniref:Uncharacterized protein n=1 Tax=Selaginella moellendorffii TaxID=88036 RepID=D8SDC3_SELML|nr:hypothetical protein SELMODRAFT_420857 [Selaginella moellendorffii]